MTRASGYGVAWAKGLMIKLPHCFSTAWGSFCHDYSRIFLKFQAIATYHPHSSLTPLTSLHFLLDVFFKAITHTPTHGELQDPWFGPKLRAPSVITAAFSCFTSLRAPFILSSNQPRYSTVSYCIRTQSHTLFRQFMRVSGDVCNL